ncbi:MAG: tungsten formylmethanofuran dehydrogenase [Candidatus Omnitrophica bacterium CG11_big_fil_rev_8_21_14_0_20_42_13]|uniref:Tungsten formylmethanofuran dehydrogenase n=1 Tax=Candidatus Ghiorseimicrobium undicola TaxID=1974746 RepID=A0A2H0LX68_9BACT|nr:MAG: tungsten formylmethanofuran dehydrogenase [Candidatus Omnitrophica bacterium CG11_big_fil_rev_8_21_14_0_20_42_13]
MPKIKINKERCKGCQLCILYCPKRLIKKDTQLNKKGLYPVNFIDGECSGCKFCALVCPDNAIEVFK